MTKRRGRTARESSDSTSSAAVTPAGELSSADAPGYLTGVAPDESPAEAPVEAPTEAPSFGRSMTVMWIYTLLRFGLFFALWGLLYLLNVRGYIGAGIALVLSVPLSWVLLSRPRRAFAANLEQRFLARQQRRATFDARLQGDDDTKS
ncbi:MAG: DUF4229 domain-containing protein [Actinobacteria bacterium]|nr:DUF4229 domain-containing protein [Actinomycetota bacterium]